MPVPKEPLPLQRWISVTVIVHFLAFGVLHGVQRLSDNRDRYAPALTYFAAVLAVAYLLRVWTDLKYGWAQDHRLQWHSREQDPLFYCFGVLLNAIFLVGFLGFLVDLFG